ncbi:MAG: hypothetical protein FJZ01_07365 [Candidatus Sericytochromatia bacterium]|nr:hypothetical protein [Candidatus Tanganyikabacteria bacterium]
MENPPHAKTRFDLVSGGFGKIAGGLVQFFIGLVAIFFWRDLGITLMILGAIYAAWGAWGIVSGAQAPQKEIRCPHCGEGNTLLSDVKEFACYNCQKPLKLVRR